MGTCGNLAQEGKMAQRELTMKWWLPSNQIFLIGAAIELHGIGVYPWYGP